MVNTSECIICKIQFIKKKNWQLTCSYECGYKHQNSKKPKKTNIGKCKRCNKSLINKRSHAIYCSKTCKSMDHTYKHRARTRIAGVTRRMEIIERDNFCCYICDIKLDIKEIELDHLIPVSKGGNSSSENVAVSCMNCNRARGNRINSKQLAKIQQLKVSI
jgi:hypothetical protein